MSFKDKIVLISGGTGGLGHSVTEGQIEALAQLRNRLIRSHEKWKRRDS